MEKLTSGAALQDLSRKLAAETSSDKAIVRVCMTGCRAHGAEDLMGAFQKEVDSQGLANEVEIRSTGCQGFCARAPVASIDPQDIFYQELTPKHVPDIVSRTLKDHRVIERLLYRNPESRQRIPFAYDVPFYKGQLKNVLRNCGKIDPTNISHYVVRGGYSSLAKALYTMDPEEVIREVTDSGLRGRGGAGFPTGIKWSFARKAIGEPKYIICNGDEGDPGAFMDRAVLEGDPHSVLEGMIIAAYATGASTGYVFVRAEYPIAVEHLNLALDQARELGLVGQDILGSGLDFDLEIREGAGAFVSGEETALLASIEGDRGVPRPRPPFPAQSGLWGKPTNINNVETFANVPLIILNGSEWYSSIGTERGKGTKIFSLAGKIDNTGLVEVPIGTSLRQVIFDIGGGVPRGKKFKAVQMGGPSGGCVPEQYLDLPVDYETLVSVGAIMGSGGVIVMDENTCMVETARYFLAFTQTESCGKCVPCRLGTKRMLEILIRITEGQGQEGDVEILSELAEGVKDSSLCGLGQTAPNPVQTSVRYFRDEYDEHIRNQRCPGGVCEALISFYIDPELCQACLICMRQCPVDAIEGGKNTLHVIDQDKCTKCFTCLNVCPPNFDAVKVISGEPVPSPLPTDQRELVRVKRNSR